MRWGVTCAIEVLNTRSFPCDQRGSQRPEAAGMIRQSRWQPISCITSAEARDAANLIADARHAEGIVPLQMAVG